MTLRFSLVMIGCLSMAGACLAVERTPSPVEVEEAVDAASTGETESTPGSDEAAAEASPEAATEVAAEPAAAEAPVPATEAPKSVAEAPKPTPLAPAQQERLKAFSRGPLRFTSVGRIKAFMIKLDRNLLYTLKPLARNGQVQAVAVTMVDRANGDKVTKGRIDVARNGALRTRTATLTNACNIGSIDPVVRQKLLEAEGPVTSRGHMEISGAVHAIEVTHTREGEVAEDGSMKVKSESESADGKVHLTTVTELAPDGLPVTAETTGTIAKGPIDLDVNLKLTREGGDSSSVTGE